MALFDQISNDIKEAMKARDKVWLETLRNIKKVFIEAKTAPGADDTLEDADALKILSKLAKQGKDAAVTFVTQNRQDLADNELEQVKVIEEYLPKQMSEEEIKQAVKEIIAATGATSMKDMGKVMGTASKQLAGKADGKIISGIVKKLLAWSKVSILNTAPRKQNLFTGRNVLSGTALTGYIHFNHTVWRIQRHGLYILSEKQNNFLHFLKIVLSIFAIFQNKNIPGVNIAKMRVQRQDIISQRIMWYAAKMCNKR